MRYGITYGDQKFYNSRVRAKSSLEKYTDRSFLFTETDLKNFESQYPNILLNKNRGGGYWLFKSIFLNEMFKEMDDGDEIIYMDAGIEVIDDLDVFFDIAKNNNGFCLFVHPHKNYKFIKRDCFILMDCENEYYHESYQCDASIQIYIKNDKTLKFLQDYLYYCSDERILTDLPNTQGFLNLNGFMDHRHDQSVLTLLSLKNNIPRFKQPTQFYTHWDYEILSDYERQESMKYSIKFNHHRIRE